MSPQEVNSDAIDSAQASVSLTPAEALQRAVASHQAGRYVEAESNYRSVLAAEPMHFDALHLCAMLIAQQGRLDESADFLARALQVNPQSVVAHANRANVLKARGRCHEAIQHIEHALALQPDVADLLNLRGAICLDLNRYEDALGSLERALALKPQMLEALYNRGLALQSLGRHDEALASYDQALALKPDFVEAWHNRGTALKDLDRVDDALSSWDRALALRPDFAPALNNRGAALRHLKRAQPTHTRTPAPDEAKRLVSRGVAEHDRERFEQALESYDQALALKPDFVEALSNRGAALKDLRRYDEALASYDKALAIRPDFADALSNRSAALLALARYQEALETCDRALAIEPNFAEALNNRGTILVALERFREAIDSYDHALAIKPGFAEALLNRGSALAYLRKDEEAVADFRRALELDEHLPYARGMLVHSQLYCCDWTNLPEQSQRLIDDVRAGKPAAEPFAFLGISDSAHEHLLCARTWVADKWPAAPIPAWRGERYAHERIRVAYLSADFHAHATAYLMAELFERHDRRRFEIIGVSFGPHDSGPMRSRLQSAFDRFVDVRLQSDAEVARLLRDLEIDIAVDLKGFTHDARTGVMALRPAPVQVNYLGYPGTMGAPYIDYIVADRVVIPSDEQACYAEKVVYLPDSYQANDSQRAVAPNPPTRQEAGLPETGFVFCSFNSNYKIKPAVFEVWMRLLRQVEGSVLWLLAANEPAPHNLRQAAMSMGVAATRLIFAPKVALPDHLTRHRLADLFLDTLPINAHTTGSDALWAGLPVLTCMGNTFAGRVAASLLHAVGLNELVTRSLDEYESVALRLASDVRLLAVIKDKLVRNRAHSSLFDNHRFRRHIEAAYVEMWERQQRGQPPAGFAVAPID